MKNSKRGFAPIIILLIVLVVGICIYMYIRKPEGRVHEVNEVELAKINELKSEIQSRVKKSTTKNDWLIYIDDENKISIQFPKTLNTLACTGEPTDNADAPYKSNCVSLNNKNDKPELTININKPALFNGSNFYNFAEPDVRESIKIDGEDGYFSTEGLFVTAWTKGEIHGYKLVLRVTNPNSASADMLKEIISTVNF
jgi:hypothetical protein